MSRYTNALKTAHSAEQAGAIISEYLGGEGFKYVDERGEMVWRKGVGALANPQFIKAEAAADGTVHIEAWTAGVSLVPGVYGGEMNPMEGAFGFGPKLALKPRVRELETRLGGTPVEQTASAAAVASWYPDPTGRHEQRYWDGTQWTADVS
ncbi:MAG: DUF2510 domain-containing protein, partial [Coriobacteriia bacterium]|nr:DUF2510 domain-containing protein [Coriobacteriia bacterium]